MQKPPRYYAIKAHKFPSHPFPKFWDSYPTLTSARKAAKQAIEDGWQICEIMRDAPRTLGQIGIARETIEVLTT